MLPASQKIHLAIGTHGTGKTFHLAGQVPPHVAMRRAEGFDPIVIIHDKRAYRPGGRDLQAFAALAPHGNYLKSVADFRERAQRSQKWRNARWLAFWGCRAAPVVALAEGLAIRGRPVVLVVDELEDLGRSSRDGVAGFYAANQGRLAPLDVFGTAHRPQFVAMHWLNSATRIDIFRLHEEKAAAKLEATTGTKLADQIRGLPRGRFLRFEPGAAPPNEGV